jgi:hypothetical protein
MFLHRKENDLGGLCPPPSRRLSGEIGLPVFDHHHGLRHPLGIYNVSPGKIVARFKKVSKELEPYLKVENEKQVKGDWFAPLQDAQERVLYSLDEHVDECYSILDCFFSDRSMRKKNAHVKLFAKHIKPHGDPLDALVNKMKHRNARLRGIVLFLGNQIVPGYFLEGMHPGGAIGPDLNIRNDPGGLTAGLAVYRCDCETR